MAGERRPHVLMSYQAPPGGGNPYTRLLSSALEGKADLSYFSIRRGLFGRWDVLHVHWPETLVRSQTPIRTALSLLSGFLLIGRLTVTRRPVVWTVHNRASHEQGGLLERLFLRALTRRVRLRIFLNESIENELSEGVVILHGTYSPVTEPLLAAARADQDQGEGVQSDLLTFGVLRPYKGVESLISSARQTDLRVRIEGRPVSTSFRAELERGAESAPNVSFAFGHRSDEDLIASLIRTKAVVLPYRSMYNSGALLFALSSGVPVIAPVSGANLALQREVGPEWLHLYEGALTPGILEEASLALSSAERRSLEWDRRDWETAARLHARVYTQVMRSDIEGVVAGLGQEPDFVAHSDANARGPKTITTRQGAR